MSWQPCSLFGIVRRTLLLPAMRDTLGARGLPLAFVIALLWALHPLQTESVTYIVQRAESLVGLFYLLTLYCFIRGASSGSPLPLGEGPGVRAAGDTSRNTLAVLHDRPHPSPLPKGEGTVWYVARRPGLFVGHGHQGSDGLRPADRAPVRSDFLRRLVPRGLAAATRLLPGSGRHLAVAGRAGAFDGQPRQAGGTSPQEFTWWSYLLTQPGVIVYYLWLSVWPVDQCLDYGWPAAKTVTGVFSRWLPCWGCWR